ncbi:MAG: hypothetical protein ABFE07_29570 [Armatimonadia bacterium]
MARAAAVGSGSEVVIREDEWLAELERLGVTEGEEGVTSGEIQERTGWGTKKVIKLLKRGIVRGVVTVGRGLRTNLVGVTQKVPVYRFLAAKAKKAR